MSDPLSLLRQEVRSGGNLELKDGFYTLGGYRLSQDTTTAFKRSLDKAEDYYYTLNDLIYCYENASLTFAEYRKNSIHAKIKGLVDSDRTALLSYLSGSAETVAQIDVTIQSSWVAPEGAAVVSSNKHGKSSRSSHHRESSSSATAAASSSQSEHRRQKRKADEALAPPSSDGQAHTGDSSENDRISLKDIMKDFFPVYSNKAAVFNVPGDTEDFKSVLKIFNDTVLKPQQAADSVEQASAMQTAAAAPLAPAETVKTAQSMRPIIIVPAVFTSCMNMSTGKDFLEKGRFVRLADVEIRKIAATASRSRNELIIREGSSQKYRLTDDPGKLSTAEWERVVAVFVTGQEWQISKWPAPYNNPVHLCQQVLVLHMAITNDLLPPNIQAWACRVVRVDHFKEHINSKAQGEFWQYFDDFIRLRKPHLIAAPAPR